MKRNQLLATSCWAAWQLSMFVSFASGQQFQSDIASPTENQSIESNYLIGDYQPATNQPASSINNLVPSEQIVETKSYKLSGRYYLQQGTNQGYLILECNLPKGNYIHSLTQGGDLNPSTIRVSASADYAIGSQFLPDVPPTVIEKDPVFAQRLEKHKVKVQFFVPIQIRDGVDANELTPEMVFEGQVCSDAGVCMPLRDIKVRAGFAGYFERSAEQQSDSETTQNK